jgi:hypothetical protein
MVVLLPVVVVVMVVSVVMMIMLLVIIGVLLVQVAAVVVVVVMMNGFLRAPRFLVLGVPSASSVDVAVAVAGVAGDFPLLFRLLVLAGVLVGSVCGGGWGAGVV